MIDDMSAVGLEHILNDALGFCQIILIDGLRCQLLVANKSRR